MVNSADVKSLLVRLHDEIQSGPGNVMANQVSFAQSLGDSLVGSFIPVATKDKVAGAAVVAPKGEAVLSVALEDEASTGVVSKSELEMPQPAERPSVQALPQIKDTKTEDAASPVIDLDATAEKTPAKSTAVFIEIKGKTETKKGKAREDHKRGEVSVSASAGAVIPAEPKTVAIDSTEQVVDAKLMITGPPPVDQPVQVNTSDGKKAGGELPVGSPILKSSGDQARRLMVQAAKTDVSAQEGRKGKGVAANADDTDDTDVDEERMSDGVSHTRAAIPDGHPNVPVTAKTAVGANESVPATAGLIATLAPVVSQPVSVNHTGIQIRDSSPANVMQTVADPGGKTMELQQVSMQEHRTLAATASSLEVGVASGTHGWLKIRAELTDTGGIKAALSSTSTTGQEMLHRELPSLSGFLEQEHVAVSSLVVHQSASSSGFEAGSSNDGGAAGQRSPGENGATGNHDQPQSFGGMKNVIVPDGSLDVRPDDFVASRELAGGGGWLSVRA